MSVSNLVMLHYGVKLEGPQLKLCHKNGSPKDTLHPLPRLAPVKPIVPYSDRESFLHLSSWFMKPDFISDFWIHSDSPIFTFPGDGVFCKKIGMEFCFFFTEESWNFAFLKDNYSYKTRHIFLHFLEKSALLLQQACHLLFWV